MAVFDFFNIYQYKFIDTTMEESKRRIQLGIANNVDVICSHY
jgi:hypothetical protein